VLAILAAEVTATLMALTPELLTAATAAVAAAAMVVLASL